MPVREYRCVICGAKAQGYGHNPAPLKYSGECCDGCNAQQVIPARLGKLKSVMTYDQRYAALELGDKLAAFAEQYGLPDTWIKGMYSRAKLAAKKSTGVNIDEA